MRDNNEIIPRLLLLTNTIQFLLCAVQITLHTTFLFFVFTVYMTNFRPYLSHVSPYILASTIIYNINVSFFILVTPFVAD